MLSKFAIGTLMTLTVMTGVPEGSWGVSPVMRVSQANPDVRFICRMGYDRQTGKQLPTTYAWTKTKKIAIIRWETTAFKGYTPQERCEKVSPKFDEAYRNGSLQFLTNGRQGKKSVICTARQYDGPCVTTLMTLRSTDNPLQVLQGLVATLRGRTVGPIRHSSGVPQRFYEVNIDNYLETAEPE